MAQAQVDAAALINPLFVDGMALSVWPKYDNISNQQLYDITRKLGFTSDEEMDLYLDNFDSIRR